MNFYRVMRRWDCAPGLRSCPRSGGLDFELISLVVLKAGVLLVLDHQGLLV